jgi:uncharacterized protein (DUF2336 family)
MSEYQNATVIAETAHAAVAARPRISADAFRNLTARLKKPDVAIPDVKPTLAVTPAPVVALVVVEANVFEPAPIAVEPIVAEFAPIAVEALTIEPLPVFVEPKTIELEPVVEAPPVVELQPITLEPVSEVVAPFEIEGIRVENVALNVDATIQPVAVADAIQIEPARVAIEELAVVRELATVAPLPSFEANAEIAVEPAIVEPMVEAYAFPLLPDPVVLQPVNIEPEPAPEIGEKGGFEENFTYVPEAGKDVKPADLAALDEAVKQGVAERAIQLELENIWRLLLAKPTSEDRLTYLREAKEIHADDEEWNKPEPEHDLSRIQPAAVLDVESLNLAADQDLEVIIERSLADNLPVAEGQDLTELTRSLLDMMAAGNASGLPQERALAADTLLRLVPRLEVKPLLMLAQRLSMMDSPPHLLVSRLIRDPRVEIAGPLLEDCPHIGDKELEQVVQEGEPDKLRLIARRRKLSRAISEALIKSGDPSVVLTLVRNMEAEISHDGFQSLLVLCENHEELLAPLATRQDLTAPMAFEMFWLAPVQLRRFILSRFLTDSETLTKILKITMAANSEDDAEPEPLNQHTLLEALERAARGQIEVAAEELSGVMKLSVATVAKILSDLQGDALVVMLKAAVYPRSSMLGLLKRMQSADLPLISRERDLSELQSMFETLSFNKARILLTYWDWAQSKTGPYAAPH